MSIRKKPLGLFSQLASRFSIRTQFMLIYGLLMTTLTLGSILVINSEMTSSSRHQADSIGQLLSEQTASAATDMLVTGDRLSLNVLLGQLVQNPYVTQASIYSIDNRRIARATTHKLDETLTGPVYSSPIHYQDVIAGYARLSLNETLLTQKPREALLIITAIGILLLLAGLVFLYLYSDTLRQQLATIERQLRSILALGNHQPLTMAELPTGEVSRLSSIVESQLTAMRMKEPEEEPVQVLETAAILAIRAKNLGRLQQLLAPKDLQEILRTHSRIIDQATDYYGGSVTYTPEGNAYIRFSSNDSEAFSIDALCCGLMIAALSEKADEINIASIHVGAGLSLSDQQSEFPEERHPALGDSAASQALTLANISEPDGLHMFRSQVNWLPADLPDIQISEHHEEIVLIKGLKNEQAEELRSQIFEVSDRLH